MKHLIRTTVMLLLPLVFVALAPMAHGSRAERLAQFQKYAEAPIKDFRYFQLIGFETLSDHTVAVWTGVNKVYLIKLKPPCPDIDFADTLSLGSSQTHLFTQRFDTVRFGRDRCMVDTIRPVDYKAMRSAARAAKESTD